MRRSTLLMCALLVTSTYGCERVKKQVAPISAAITRQIDALRERFSKKKSPRMPAGAQATPGPGAAPAPTPPPPPPPPPGPTANAPRARDIPYVSEDTGTVAPGMAERDVYSMWGAPVAVRHAGEFTYLFFKNGCEYSCGTLDVVTLQNGQVVDAIVRWPGHAWSGPSHAATGGEGAVAPAGGDNLQMPPQPAPEPAPDTTQAKPPMP